MKKHHFYLALLLYSAISLFLAISTPISPHEAKQYYADNIVSWLMHIGEMIYPGFLGLRLFSLLSAALSVSLFYILSKRHFKNRSDAYFATTIFMFLPGILTATAMANIGILVLPLVLLFVLLYEEGNRWALPFIMLALFFLHEASILFFLALLLYAIVRQEKILGIFAATFIIASLYLSKGIAIGGRPSGHFIEIFGLYAAVFSPLLFLYFFYTMYRKLLREEGSLMWYISFTALAVSLLLSLRQKVYITDFAPYVMIATIEMVELFMQSLRVRLPQFQTNYRRGFYFVILVLILSILPVIFNRTFYLMTKDRTKQFAGRIYHPYFLAEELKSKGIECYDAKEKERRQLRYYGITPCSKP